MPVQAIKYETETVALSAIKPKVEHEANVAVCT